MSNLAQACADIGLDIERDVPVVGRRRAKDWAQLFGKLRKLESQEAQVLERERQRLTDAQSKVVALIEENAELKRQLQRLALKERAREIELPEKDTVKLLAPLESGEPTDTPAAAAG